MRLVSQAPHIRSHENTFSIMFDVLIALTPAIIASGFFFGYRAILLILVCAVSCVLFEFLWQKLLKVPVTVFDLSAVITGVLLAFNLSVTTPYWTAVLGSAFAIIIVKQMFGGIGQNFMNPALAARVFLFISFPQIMTNFVEPLKNIDAVSVATPLNKLKDSIPIENIPDLFWGNIPGCIGETSVFMLIIGAAYLIIKGVISWHTPLTYILTVALVTFIYGNFDSNFMFTHVMSGGLILGAFFMATDYSTSPITKIGKFIMGLGCGILTCLMRLFSSAPEGVSFSIIIMNCLVPLIDKATVPVRFGGRKK